jgi:hypothetical protein
METGVVGGEEGVGFGLDEVVEAALVPDVVVVAGELVECCVVVLLPLSVLFFPFALFSG